MVLIAFVTFWSIFFLFLLFIVLFWNCIFVGCFKIRNNFHIITLTSFMKVERDVAP